MKRKILVLLTMLVVATTIVGCGMSEENKELKANYETKAKKNATDYIKNKYNFDATVVKAEVVTEGLFNTDMTGMVFVEMKYDNKNFTVYITGESDTSSIGYDNYQAKEIVKDVENRLKNITGSKKHELRLTYGSFNTSSESSQRFGLIKEYYTGDNLGEVLKTHNTQIVYHVAYNQVRNITTEQLNTIFGKDVYVVVIGYDNDTKLKSVKSSDYALDIDKNKATTGLKPYYILCNDYVEYKNGKVNYVSAYTQQTNYFGIEYCTDNNKSVIFTKDSLDALTNWGSRYEKATVLTDAYRVSASEVVNLWIPTSKIYASNYNKVKVIYSYTNSSGNKTYYKTLDTKVIGNNAYLYVQLPKEKNIKFSVVVTK